MNKKTAIIMVFILLGIAFSLLYGLSETGIGLSPDEVVKKIEKECSRSFVRGFFSKLKRIKYKERKLIIDVEIRERKKNLNSKNKTEPPLARYFMALLGFCRHASRSERLNVVVLSISHMLNSGQLHWEVSYTVSLEHYRDYKSKPQSAEGFVKTIKRNIIYRPGQVR